MPTRMTKSAGTPGRLVKILHQRKLRLHHRQDSQAISDAFDRMLVADVPDAHRALIDALAGVDPYFTTLVDLRQRLAALCATQLS